MLSLLFFYAKYNYFQMIDKFNHPTTSNIELTNTGTSSRSKNITINNGDILFPVSCRLFINRTNEEKKYPKKKVEESSQHGKKKCE